MATLAHSNVGGVRVVHITGTLNQHGVDEIQSGLVAEARGGGPLVIDLAGVDMINTPGLAILLAAHRDTQRSGGRMVITGLAAPLQDLLHRCQLDRVFTVAPQADDAIVQAKA
jgi:anti-anti-sigma factor